MNSLYLKYIISQTQIQKFLFSTLHSMKTLTLTITGMTCASCARNNEFVLADTAGILRANVNFANKKAMVEYDEAILSEDAVKNIIRENGYGVEENHAEHSEHHHEHGGMDIRKQRNRLIGSAILSVPLLVEMFYPLRTGVMFAGKDLIMWMHLVLATVVVFYFGWRFHRMAFAQARKFRANMDTLVSLGTLVAYFYSLWAITVDKE